MQRWALSSVAILELLEKLANARRGLEAEFAFGEQCVQEVQQVRFVLGAMVTRSVTGPRVL